MRHLLLSALLTVVAAACGDEVDRPEAMPAPTEHAAPVAVPARFALELESFLATWERIRQAKNRNPCIQEEEKEVAAVSPETPLSFDKIETVMKRYRSRFRRYPNYLGHSFGVIYTHSTPPRLLGRGIVVTVEEVVDPATLAKSKRLPACLDGVPVWVRKIPTASRLIDPRPTERYQEAGDDD